MKKLLIFTMVLMCAGLFSPLLYAQSKTAPQQKKLTPQQQQEQDLLSLKETVRQLSEQQNQLMEEVQELKEAAAQAAQAALEKQQAEELQAFLNAGAGSNPQRVKIAGDAEGIVLSNFTIRFAGEMAALSQATIAILKRAAELLVGYPVANIVVGGHSALYGAEDGQITISQQRAQNVADELIKNGVEAERVSIEFYGATRPVAPNTFAGRKENRRAEIIFVDPTASAPSSEAPTDSIEDETVF